MSWIKSCDWSAVKSHQDYMCISLILNKLKIDWEVNNVRVEYNRTVVYKVVCPCYFFFLILNYILWQSIVRKTKESVKKRYFHPKCNKIPTNNKQILCNNFCLTRVEKLVEVDG